MQRHCILGTGGVFDIFHSACQGHLQSASECYAGLRRHFEVFVVEATCAGKMCLLPSPRFLLSSFPASCDNEQHCLTLYFLVQLVIVLLLPLLVLLLLLLFERHFILPELSFEEGWEASLLDFWSPRIGLLWPCLLHFA